MAGTKYEILALSRGLQPLTAYTIAASEGFQTTETNPQECVVIGTTTGAIVNAMGKWAVDVYQKQYPIFSAPGVRHPGQWRCWST